MPTNLYGPNDNFDLTSSHVLPALLRKFHDAKLDGVRDVVIWGSGTPRREFLHVDDLADACLFLMRRYEVAEHINVGTGEDVTIRALAEMIRDVVYPEAHLVFDSTKPDGTPKKQLDVTRLRRLGWRHRIDLQSGIERAYEWFVRSGDQALALGAATSRPLSCAARTGRHPDRAHVAPAADWSRLGTSRLTTMKILVVHEYYTQAGGEDSVFRLETDLLRSHGHDAVLYTGTQR